MWPIWAPPVRGTVLPCPRPMVGRGEIPKCGKGVHRVEGSEMSKASGSSQIPVFAVMGEAQETQWSLLPQHLLPHLLLSPSSAL